MSKKGGISAVSIETTLGRIGSRHHSPENRRKEANTMTPASLAYMGDALYETFVRDYLLKQSHDSVNRLHRQTITYVNASAQAYVIGKLAEELSEEEAGVVRRGRNHKSGTVPRGAAPGEYRYATAFEALLGWLYMCGNMDRLMEIMTRSLMLMEERSPVGGVQE